MTDDLIFIMKLYACTQNDHDTKTTALLMISEVSGRFFSVANSYLSTQ